jgi:hypothetical protein
VSLRADPLVAVPLSRAWFHSSIQWFLQLDADTVIGRLTQYSDVDVVPAQTEAWLAQIDILRVALRGLSGSVFLEFNIPRMGRRIDAVLLVGPGVFVVEFKVGETRFVRAAINQVWDYALDLKNFHEGSHAASVVPILVATEASQAPSVELLFASDRVCSPLQASAGNFRAAIDHSLREIVGPTVDA